MHLRTLQVLSTVASLSSATNLFVSDYSGNITTLSLTECNGRFNLHQTFANDGCAPNPSWLTLDANHGTLYCLDEGLEVKNGSLSSYTIGDEGQLTRVMKESTINGPVSGVIFGDPAGERAIALAHYVGSAISTWSLDANHTGSFALNQEIVFPNFTTPGPNPLRQENPHEHEAILDPTGNFLIVPDLGADLVRVYSFNTTTNLLNTEEPLKVLPGSGPRHAVFYNPWGVTGGSSKTFMLLVSELANSVTSFEVEYPETGGLKFTQVYNGTTYGDLEVPDGNAAAEIVISPDNRFLTISNRNNTSFHIPSSHHNDTKIPSDSLATFSLHPNGTLSFQQLWPAGGMFPRHFSMNKYGNLVAVGMQYDKSVVVLERDVGSGLLGKPVSRWQGGGNVTCVVWED